MEDRTEAISRFTSVLDKNDLELIHTNGYKDLLRAIPISSKYVALFTTRSDVTNLCREEEKRLEKMTGQPHQIDDDKMAAVFVWNHTIGFVPDIPYSIHRWTRYFNSNVDAPCLICMESGKDRTMCSNCASIVCLDCDNRIETNVCPGCTKSMKTFRK